MIAPSTTGKFVHAAAGLMLAVLIYGVQCLAAGPVLAHAAHFPGAAGKAAFDGGLPPPDTDDEQCCGLCMGSSAGKAMPKADNGLFGRRDPIGLGPVVAGNRLPERNLRARPPVRAPPAAD